MIERKDFSFTISDEAFEYLKVQRCASADHLSDRTAFEANYHREIFDLYDTIAPFLPSECAAVLDIGAGLGGIDAVLNRHYGGQLAVYPLDGLNEAPVVAKHDRPFSNRDVARRFLTANGVTTFGYYAAGGDAPRVARPFPLVVSFASYCFHYAPDVYLNFVKACAAPGAVLIFDVRRGKADWIDTLERYFGPGRIASTGKKFQRMVYAAT